jgi:Fe-Mn family superoxide dismutase
MEQFLYCNSIYLEKEQVIVENNVSSDKKELNRRTFIAQASTITAGALLVSCTPDAANMQQNTPDATSGLGNTFQLPSLGYAYNALEPHIDAKTMELHHDLHHAAYVKGLNEALKDEPLGSRPLAEILHRLNELPEGKHAAVRNYGGGHANHTMFWEIMTPGGSAVPTGDLANAINASFGSFDAFKTAFQEAGTKIFGSGWVWLLVENNQLTLTSSSNQDTPLLDGKVPVMGNDVWEHAYYLHYQNLRADYLKAWWNVVNWDKVAARYGQVLKGA